MILSKPVVYPFPRQSLSLSKELINEVVMVAVREVVHVLNNMNFC